MPPLYYYVIWFALGQPTIPPVAVPVGTEEECYEHAQFEGVKWSAYYERNPTIHGRLVKWERDTITVLIIGKNGYTFFASGCLPTSKIKPEWLEIRLP